MRRLTQWFQRVVTPGVALVIIPSVLQLALHAFGHFASVGIVARFHAGGEGKEGQGNRRYCPGLREHDRGWDAWGRRVEIFVSRGSKQIRIKKKAEKLERQTAPIYPRI